MKISHVAQIVLAILVIVSLVTGFIPWYVYAMLCGVAAIAFLIFAAIGDFDFNNGD